MLNKNKTKSAADDTEGAAIFELVDEETGLSQKFAFSLRYYLGATSVKLKKMKRAKRDRKHMTKEEIALDKELEAKDKEEEESDKKKKEKEEKEGEKETKSGKGGSGSKGAGA